MCRHVLGATKLHADDTPVPVLAPGNGKTKTGRLWTYVRDDRPADDNTAPAVWFTYSPDRKGEHPREHLKDFAGTMQADAYSGFHHLYDVGRIREAACWAHARRKFHDIHAAHPSPTTTGALERIGALYRIEEQIRGKPPDERRAIRQTRAAPLLAELRAWMEKTLRSLSPKSETTEAIRYALSPATSTTDASRLIIPPPSGRSVLSLWAGRTICSVDQTMEVRARLPSTRCSERHVSTELIPNAGCVRC